MPPRLEAWHRDGVDEASLRAVCDAPQERLDELRAMLFLLKQMGNLGLAKVVASAAADARTRDARVAGGRAYDPVAHAAALLDVADVEVLDGSYGDAAARYDYVLRLLPREAPTRAAEGCFNVSLQLVFLAINGSTKRIDPTKPRREMITAVQTV